MQESDSIEDHIFSWARERPAWQQDLFLAALDSTELPIEQVDKTIALLAGEREDAVIVRRSDLPTRGSGRDALILTDIGDLSNVNALPEGGSLYFAEHGISCIFGGNGAGKTGYSRILRHAGRTLHRETVLTNLGGPATREIPSASLGLSVDGQPSRVALDLTRPAPGQTARICVFDAKAGLRYISTKTEVDYAPAALNSLQRLADAQKTIAAEIDRRIGAIRISPIEPDLFEPGTEARQLVDSLDASTQDAEIDGVAGLDGTEREQRLRLRQQLGEIESRNSPQLRQVALREAGQIEALNRELRAVAELLSTEALERAQQEQTRLAVAEEAARLSREQFTNEPVHGVGSSPWRLMWKAAEEFAGSEGMVLVPEEDGSGVCMLCQQGLSHEAHQRMRGFADFVSGSVNEERTAAERAVKDRLSGLPDLALLKTRHSAALELLASDDDPRLSREIEAWLQDASDCVSSARAGSLGSASPPGEPPSTLLTTWVATRRESAERHAVLDQSDQAAEIRLQLSELNSRERFADKRDQIRVRRDSLASIAKLQRIRDELNTSAISRKMTALSEAFVSAGLQEELKKHLKALGFDGLEVRLVHGTSGGTPHVQLKLASVGNVPLTDVLSEGEQRRLALAMFLAEVAVIDSDDPVVLDDPVCSIDQEGRRHIASALAEMAQRRQVIVFSHEMPFIGTLREKAQQQRPPVALHTQHLLRLGPSAGHVRNSLPWEGLPAKERLGPLRNQLSEIRRVPGDDPATYESKVRMFCNYLRQAFERAVEDSVLGNVIRRGEDGVSPGRLKEVEVGSEVIQLVDRGIGEASVLLHDRARAYMDSPPTVDELEVELEVFADLMGLLGQRRSTADKARRKQKDRLQSEQRAMDAGRASVRPAKPADVRQLNPESDSNAPPSAADQESA